MRRGHSARSAARRAAAGAGSDRPAGADAAARRAAAARTTADGEIILLDEQDRSLWNREQIDEGLALVERALRSGAGPYTLQAAIAAVHAEARQRNRLVADRGLYDSCAHRAVAGGRAQSRRGRRHADGPQAGLELIDAILARRDLTDYHLAHAARADLCRRLGRTADAIAATSARSRSRIRRPNGGFSSAASPELRASS